MKRGLINALFWALAAAFLAGIVLLAMENRSIREPDSLNNLDNARNLLAGSGFQSNIVQQLFVEQTLPNPETIRFPGLPALLAVLLWIFGYSPALIVAFNGVTILATAFVLRASLARLADHRVGNLAAAIFLASGNYEPIYLWNNNLLTLLTTLLVYVGARQAARPLPPWGRFAALVAIGVFGVNVKPTFLLSFAAFAAVLLVFPPRRPSRSTKSGLSALVLLLLAIVAGTSPYWARNLARFGNPLYSPATGIRLADRYGRFPTGVLPTVRYGSLNTIRFDRPLSYGELAETLGWGEVIDREINLWNKGLSGLVGLNSPLFYLALLGTFMHFRRRAAKAYLLGLALLAEPLFTTVVYWRYEPRYLWPAFPVLLYLCVVSWLEYRAHGRAGLSAAWRKRVTVLVVALVVLAFPARFRATLGLWKESVKEARTSPAEWIAAVRNTPPSAVILSDHPWAVAWHGERRAVISPGGGCEELAEVARRYRPSYFLFTRYRFSVGRLRCEPLMTVVARDPTKPPGWVLYRLK